MLDFDPDRHIAPDPAPAAQPSAQIGQSPKPVARFAEPEPPKLEAPGAWLHGLALLRDVPAPAGFTVDRWKQVAADSHALVTTWLGMVLDAAWSIEDLWGYDPDADFYGLALALRGKPLLYVHPDVACMGWEEGNRVHRRLHYARVKPGTPLLWQPPKRKGRA